jgi:hypothetical protein
MQLNLYIFASSLDKELCVYLERTRSPFCVIYRKSMRFGVIGLPRNRGVRAADFRH